MSELYKGSINELKEDILKLKDRLELTTTGEYSICYNAIYRLNNIYKNSTNESLFECIPNNEIYNYLGHNKIIKKASYSFINSFIDNKQYIKDISDVVCDIILILMNEYNIDDVISNYKKSLSEKEAIEIIYDFLNTYHKNKIDYFNYLKNMKRFYNTNVFSDKSDSTLGEFIASIHANPYIFVNNKYYTLESISTLLHEFGHACEYQKLISLYSNKRVAKYFNNSFYLEINSTKYEKEFIDFCIKENIYKNNAVKLLYSFYNDMINNAANLYNYSLIDNRLLKDYNYLLYCDEDINRCLDVEYDEENIIKYTEMDIYDSILYFFGSLLSIYFISDKEKEQMFNSIKFDNFNENVFELLDIDIHGFDNYIKQDLKILGKIK